MILPEGSLKEALWKRETSNHLFIQIFIEHLLILILHRSKSIELPARVLKGSSQGSNLDSNTCLQTLVSLLVK